METRSVKRRLIESAEEKKESIEEGKETDIINTDPDVDTDENLFGLNDADVNFVLSNVEDSLANKNPVERVMRIDETEPMEPINTMEFLTENIDTLNPAEIEHVDANLNDEITAEQTEKTPFFNDLFNLVIAPFNTILSKFTSQPTFKSIAVLFISKHGGYSVHINARQKMDLYTFSCPVKHLIRYQYAPLSTCGWANGISTHRDYWIVHNQLRTHIQNFDGETINADTVANILSSNLVPILSQTPETVIDYYSLFGKCPERGEKKICEKVDKSNKVTKIEYGDLYLGKQYELDLSGKKSSGILIMFEVTFKLPNLFFTENNTPIPELTMLVKTLRNNPLPYKCGIYNRDKTITYIKRTELTSCPFFMLYLKLLAFGPDLTSANPVFDWLNPPIWPDTNKPIYELRSAISLDNSMFNESNSRLNTIEKRQMVYIVHSGELYGFFQYADTLVNIDLSCSSFVFTRKIKSSKKLQRAISMMPNTVKVRYENSGIFGGKLNNPKTKNRSRTRTKPKNKSKRRTKARHTRRKHF